MSIGKSELILNADGSIYHLGLLPDDIAPLIITVGDPNRVEGVSKYFDKIILKKSKREFLTHTGVLNEKPISVVSTGIGTDNIDIVLNELDALFNIDFASRTVKDVKTPIKIVRIGTSGAIQPDIEVGSFVLSAYAIGLDGLLHFYQDSDSTTARALVQLQTHLDWGDAGLVPYMFVCNDDLRKRFPPNIF